MILLDISIFQCFFPDRIPWISFDFIPQLWMLVAAIAGGALLLMVAGIINSVIRYQRGQFYLGNIFFCIFALFYAIWCALDLGHLEKYTYIPELTIYYLRYDLYIFVLLLFITHTSLFFFQNRKLFRCVIPGIFGIAAMLVIALDLFGILKLPQGAAYLTLLLFVVVGAEAVMAIIQLFDTKSPRFIIFLVLLVLMEGILAFNYVNGQFQLLPQLRFDYRWIPLLYMLIITVYSFLPLERGALFMNDEEDEEDEVDEQEKVYETNPSGEIPEINEGYEAPEERPAQTVSLPYDMTEISSVDTLQGAPLTEISSAGAAQRDLLTGCLTRYSFTEYIHSLDDCNREERNLAVIVFDVKNLRTINENHGYNSGDETLKQAAGLISKVFGDMGDCYRIDGDEFVIVNESCHAGDVSRHILQLLEELKAYNERPVQGIILQLSFGYAVCRGKNSISMEELIALAERRMEEKN